MILAYLDPGPSGPGTFEIILTIVGIAVVVCLVLFALVKFVKWAYHAGEEEE